MPSLQRKQTAGSGEYSSEDANRDQQFEFERDIPDDFRESWPDRAEIDERNRLIRSRLVRRVHWDAWAPVDTQLQYHGPIFDPNEMVGSIIEQMENAETTGYTWAIVRYGRLVDAVASVMRGRRPRAIRVL